MAHRVTCATVIAGTGPVGGDMMTLVRLPTLRPEVTEMDVLTRPLAVRPTVPPDPGQPSGPGPTDPEGPCDPKPTEPTDPTGPDDPPAASP
jgi:hypothetical protein